MADQSNNGNAAILTDAQKLRINRTIERKVVAFIQDLPGKIDNLLSSALTKSLGLDRRHDRVEIDRNSQLAKLFDELISETIARRLPEIRQKVVAEFEADDGPGKLARTFKEEYSRRIVDAVKIAAEKRAVTDAEYIVKRFESDEGKQALLDDIDFNTRYSDIYNGTRFESELGGLIVRQTAKKMAYGLTEKHKPVPIEEVVVPNTINVARGTAKALASCLNVSCPHTGICSNFKRATGTHTPDLVKADDVWYCGEIIGDTGPIMIEVDVNNDEIRSYLGEDVDLSPVPF